MKTTKAYLFEMYGPLMPIDALAKTLSRSPQGLRVSLLSDSPLSRVLNKARKKIGRRVYYKSEVVAQLIDDDSLLDE